MRFMQDPRLREVRFGVCLLGLLALPLLAGCGGGGGGGSSSPTPIPTPIPIPTPTPIPTPPPTSALSTSVITMMGLTETLTENSSTVSVGGTVTYTLTLTNATPAAIPVHALSASPATPVVTLIVKDSANNSIYQPVPGPPALAIYSLAPGQSLASTVTVNGFTAAGVYTATATFGDDVTPGYSVSVSRTVTVQ